VILNIISRSEWTDAQAAGERVTPSLAAQGFVHCSDPGTVTLPANRRYAGRTDLLLLVVDPTLVPSPVRWEEGDPPHPDGLWFPHVYGPIPVAAVVAVVEFPPLADGTFHLPSALAEIRAT
jgi:uncharacterized protein (DUF952 family)